MLKVAVIGATGAVGQEFIIALNKHKWFELTQVAASESRLEKNMLTQSVIQIPAFCAGTIGKKCPSTSRTWLSAKWTTSSQRILTLYLLHSNQMTQK